MTNRMTRAGLACALVGALALTPACGDSGGSGTGDDTGLETDSGDGTETSETGDQTETAETDDDTSETGDDTSETGDETGDDTSETGDDTSETGDDTDETGDDTDETGDDTSETGDDTSETGDDTDETADVDCGCGDDETCLRGVCIDSCGGTLNGAVLDGQLDDVAVPVAVTCGGRGGAFTGQVDAGFYELLVDDLGDTALFRVIHWTLDDDGGMASEEVGGTVVDGSMADFTLFPGGYLEVVDGMAVFGYTGAFDPIVTPGGVVVMDLVEGSSAVIDAPGSFDAAMWGDSVLINGLALGEVGDGQGLYLAAWDAELGQHVGGQVATGLGASSGGLEVLDIGVTLAGGYAGFGTTWPDGGEGSRVFALWSDELGEGDELIDGGEQGFELSVSAEFADLGEGMVAAVERDADWAVTQIVVHELAVGDQTIAVDATWPLVTGPTFDGAERLGDSDLVALRHGAGYMIVDAFGE